MKYLFTSQRLGFRNWTKEDLPKFIAMNANPLVMQHFPQPLTDQESTTFLTRLQEQYINKGYTYFATELLETQELIGFTGLAYQDYFSAFTPAVDIGWRLIPQAWGKGYATEGAKRCLQFAFEDMKLDKVIAICPLQNIASERVMQKIGMHKVGIFKHPKLANYPNLERCVSYEVQK